MPAYETFEIAAKVLEDVTRSVYDDPKAGPKVENLDLVLKVNLNNPEGVLWLDTGNQTASTHDQYEKPADVAISADGDVLHKVYAKQLNINKALTMKMIKVEGPILRLMKLLPLLTRCFNNYPAIAEKHGVKVEL
jgi:putative sterol carrier protein